jgi:competence protein ComEC
MVYVIIVGLELCEPLYRSYHGLMRRIIMGCLILVCIIPFRSSVNLYQIIFVPVLALPLIGFYMMGSVSVVLLPRLNSLFNLLVVWIEQMLTYLSTNTLTLVYGKLDGLYSVLFYVILIGILLSQHRLKRGLMLIFMTSLIFLPTFYQHQQTSITFLDVGQGDSTIITSKGCTSIIDAFQGVVDYAKNQGIGVIDNLILTHSDTDHIKEAEELMTSLTVKSLYLSLSDDEYPLYQHDIKRIKQGYHMSCGSVSIDVLSPYGDERESNDGSIVLKVITEELSFLLAGDIGVHTEERLIQSYGHHLKSDVLKVAHHGSNTSTSFSFLSYVNPNYAIISAGRSNQYGFPHQEVLDRLMNKGIIIYRTDECGSIVYSPSKKKSKWEMYLPF